MAKTTQETKTWNLDDIIMLDKFPETLKQAYAQIDQLAEFYAESVEPGMTEQDFVTFSSLNESTIELLMRLGSRAELMQFADQKDPQALKLKSQCKDIEQYYTEKMQSAGLWLEGKEVEGKLQLDDANAARLFASVPDLEYQLLYDRSMASHSLPVDQENIISAKNQNGTSVLFDLYGLLDAEMSYRFVSQKGEVKVLTRGEVDTLKSSGDAYARKEAFRCFFEAYSKNIEKFFMIYQARVKDWIYTAKLRGYPTSISMRNAANHVPDEAINTLLQVCMANSKVYHRYFDYKARFLGQTKLSRFDLYAPVGEDTTNISYDDAVDLVLEAYQEFDAEFAAKARSIVDASHIDYQQRNNKISGAFCAGIAPSITPYVLTNFAGKGRDVSTIAHELGHGIHYLFGNHLSISAQHTTLPLGETASTFGEMILFDKLLSMAKDDDQKRFLLADRLADSYAGIVRQNSFTQFEIVAHQELSKGVSEEELSKLWLKSLQDHFGESVELDDMFGREWAYISHLFDRPFYCYAYSFGELLSMSLYKRYKDEGESFVPKIKQILSAGGSQSPEKVLAKVGIDMTSAQFWQDSFKIIEDWQDQLEKL